MSLDYYELMVFSIFTGDSNAKAPAIVIAGNKPDIKETMEIKAAVSFPSGASSGQ